MLPRFRTYLKIQCAAVMTNCSLINAPPHWCLVIFMCTYIVDESKREADEFLTAKQKHPENSPSMVSHHSKHPGRR